MCRVGINLSSDTKRMVLYFNPYLFAASLAQNTPYVSGNLVAYWEYSQGSGATPYSTATPLQVPDTSGSSHPIQYIVNPTPGYFSNSLTSSLNYETAYSNATVNFNNGVSFEVLFSLAQIASGQDPTIMFWDPYGGHNNGGLMLNLSASTLIPYMHNSVSGTGYLNTCNSVLSTGTWYHAVFTSNVSGYWNFYLDGYPVAYGTGFTLPTAGYDAKLGLGSPGQYVSQYGPYPYTQTMNCMFYVDMALSTPSSGSVILKDQSLNTSNLTMNTNFYSSNTLTPSLAFRTSNSVSNVYTSGAPVFSGLNTTGLTMECLFNPSGLTGNIMSLTTVSAGGVFLGFNTTSNLTVYNSGGSFSLNIAATSGTWYHSIVSINSSGAYSFYLDGLLIKSGTGFTLPSGLVTSYGLGTPAGTAFQGFQGSIGMARMYNFTLTPAQVLQNYFAVVNRVAPTNPYGLPSNFANTYVTNNLIGYWDFGKSASYAGANVLVVNDLSGNGLNMTYALTGSYYPPPYTSNGYGVSVQVGGPGGAGSTQNAYIANVAYNQTFSSTGFTFEIALTPTTIYTSGNGNFGLTITNGNSSAPQYWTHLAYANGWFIDTVNNTTETKAPSTYITNPVPIANQMMHAVATVSSSGAYNIYINGTLIGSGTGYVFPTSGAIPYALTLGSFSTGTPYGQCALVNAARAYNAPLTAANVWTNYGSVYQGLTYTPSSPGYVVNNLVGYWDFADSRSSSLSGSALNDLGPNGYNLTFGTSPTYNSTGALSFNGNGSNLASTPSTVSLNLTNGFTFEVLINLTATGTNHVISYGNSSSWVSIQMNSTSIGVVSVGYGGYALANYTAPLGQWLHVTCVFNTLTYTTASVYVNGVSYPITGGVNFTSFPNNPAGSYLSVGSVYGSISTTGINGKFAMGRIYSTALSASQVRQNYSAAFSKLYGNPYVIPPPLNQSLAFPPVFTLGSGSSTVNLSYGSISGASYGNGQYVANGSSNTGAAYRYPMNAIGTAGASSTGWFSSVAYSATGAYQGYNSLNGISGEWVTFTFPVSIILTSFSYWNFLSYGSNTFSILGSTNSGTSWTTLYTTPTPLGPTNINFNGTFTVNIPGITIPYNTFGVVVSSVIQNTQSNLVGLQFYGTPVSSLAVPPGLPYYTSNAQYTTTSLVGYWDAALTASSSGTGSKILYDLSGNGNNMIFTSAPTYFQTPPCYTVGTANTWATPITMYSYALEILVNFNPVSFTTARIINLGNPAQAVIQVTAPSTSSGVTTLTFFSNYNSSSNTVGTLTLTSGSWYHIIATSTSSTPSLYINGSSYPVQGTIGGTANQTSADWELGRASPTDSTLNGAANVAMCRFYSNALTSAQVAQNYLHCLNKLPTNAYSLPLYATNGLIGYWNFANSSSYPGTGLTLSDISGSSSSLGNLNLNNTTPSVATTGAACITYSPGSSTTSNAAYTSSGLTSSLTAFTFETLIAINAISTTTNSSIMAWETPSFPGGSAGSYLFYQWSGTQYQFVLCNNTGYTFPITLTVGQFYHIVMTVTSPTTVTFYINGTQQTINTGGAIVFPTSGNIVEFAALGAGYGYQFNGKMAMSRVYTTALGPAQVAINYANVKLINNNAYNLP